MTRFISALIPFLMMASAYAQEVKDAPIPTEINWVGIIIFLVLMVGMCVVFGFMVWWNDKKNKERESEPKT